MINVAMAQIRFLMQAAVVGTLAGAGICAVQSDGIAAQLATSAPHRDVASAFDEAMSGWMAKYGVQRGSIAVMRNDRLAFAVGYGGRGANERIPVWSLSKAITALCIANLVNDGKLRFDDPIGPLLSPVFQRFEQPADERLGRITVGQLLSHRSGIPRAFGRNSFAPGVAEALQRYEPRQASVDMLMPEIMKLSLARPPGEGYEYSNVGYILLGKIVETATGKRYESACGERVLAKAGIKEIPSFDKSWGGLTYSAGGWAMSGPEYLGFARLLRAKQSPLLVKDTRSFLETTDSKWINDRHVIASTLGINVRPLRSGLYNLFHMGAWTWHQDNAAGGAINEKRGTYFVLTGDGVGWFASFDGVNSDGDTQAMTDLDAALFRAHNEVSVWPDRDQFAAMGVGRVSKGR